ncbi:MAG TPA: PAS domain S-box protein [Bryobacteraceae bacterium]|nr:PAS domain S-box protein [Bryobacteraceae bacterium]
MKLRLREPATGHLTAVLGIVAVTVVCAALRSHINEMTVALLMLLVVLSVAAIWEFFPALVASMLGMLCLNYFFLPPIHTFTIEDPGNWIALAAFFITALIAGQLSRWAKQRSAEASRSHAGLASAYTRSLLEATLDPLMTVSGDGGINDVNTAAETATGLSRLELIGSHFAEHFTDPARAGAVCKQVFRDGSVRGHALELLHRGGHSTSVLFDGSLYRDEFGTVIGAVAALRPLGTFVGRPPEMLPEPMVVGHLGLLVKFAALFAIILGILSVIGLEFGIEWIKRITPQGTVIKMNAAVCLALLGAALWLSRKTAAALSVRLMAAITAIVGLLSLVEHVSSLNFGIDQLLYREPAADAILSIHPGLISAVTAADFLLLGLAFLLLDRRISWKSQRYWPAQYLAALSALLGIVGVLDYLLGSHAPYTYIALQTAVALLLISIGVLCVRIDRGFPALVASSTAGGALTRRLIPGAVIIPVLIGALALQALSSHLTSEWGAVTLMIIVMIVMLSAFSIWNGNVVNRGDIERQRAEAILERRQVEMSEAERLAHVGSWWRDAKADSVIWSAGLSQIAGRNPMLPPPSWKDHLAFWTPESASRLDAAVRKAMETGAPFELELEMLRADGAVRAIAERGEVERDADGQIALVRSTVQDITERKQAEAALQKSAEEISDLYNHAPCGYDSLDRDAVFVRINDTELEWLQYSRDEVVGKRRFTDFLTPDSLRTFAASFPRFKAEGRAQDLEFEMVRRDNTTFPVLASASAIRDPEGNYLMSRSTLYDVTARKREEQARAQLAAIVEHSDDAILSKTLDGAILTWNKGAPNESSGIQPAKWSGNVLRRSFRPNASKSCIK